MLYADFTIIFVNNNKIVAHFLIYYREKVYTFREINRVYRKPYGTPCLISIIMAVNLVTSFTLFYLAHDRLGVNALSLVIICNCALESLFRKN